MCYIDNNIKDMNRLLNKSIRAVEHPHIILTIREYSIDIVECILHDYNKKCILLYLQFYKETFLKANKKGIYCDHSRVELGVFPDYYTGFGLSGYFVLAALSTQYKLSEKAFLQFNPHSYFNKPIDYI